MSNLEFKAYTYTEEIKAVEYQEGMEKGFFTRYTDGRRNKDGSITTWGTRLLPSDKEVQVPYVVCPIRGYEFLVGAGYMIIQNLDNSITVMNKADFNKKYKPL